MQVSIERRTGKALLRLQGDLDFSNAAELEPIMAAIVEPEIEIDLHDIGFMDSSGAGLLLAWARDLSGQGRRLAVTGVPPAIRQDLELIGFFEVLDALAREFE